MVDSVFQPRLNSPHSSSQLPPGPPLGSQAALAAHGDTISLLPLDVICGRRSAVAGTRSREDVSDAAAFQFARSADAVYGECTRGGWGPNPALSFSSSPRKIPELCPGVKRELRCVRRGVGSWPRRGLGGGKDALLASSVRPVLSAAVLQLAGL